MRRISTEEMTEIIFKIKCLETTLYISTLNSVSRMPRSWSLETANDLINAAQREYPHLLQAYAFWNLTLSTGLNVYLENSFLLSNISNPESLSLRALCTNFHPLSNGFPQLGSNQCYPKNRNIIQKSKYGVSIHVKYGTFTILNDLQYSKELYSFIWTSTSFSNKLGPFYSAFDIRDHVRDVFLDIIGALYTFKNVKKSIF